MMSLLDKFIDALRTHGLEHFRKYYGVYRGIVTNAKDPDARGRVQVQVPSVGHSAGLDVWVDPAFSGAGLDRGMFWPPEEGDCVWVAFTAGDPSKPQTYWGGWFGKNDLPDEFGYSSGNPVKRGFITRGGHRVEFSDEAGSEKVKIAWHKAASQGKRAETPSREEGQTAFLEFTSSGGVILQVKDQKTQITITDGKIVIDAQQVEIATGADTPAVRGNEWMAWATAHTHGTAWGPSSPPLKPPPQSILSKNVKIK